MNCDKIRNEMLKQEPLTNTIVRRQFGLPIQMAPNRRELHVALNILKRKKGRLEEKNSKQQRLEEKDIGGDEDNENREAWIDGQRT